MITKKQIIGICLVLAMVFLLACAPQAAPAPAPQAPAPAPKAAPAPAAVPAAPARPAWEAEWEKTLSAAKNEGRVVFVTSLAATARAAIAAGFKKAYGIPSENIAGRSVETLAKVLAERRAGLYNYDVYVGGATTTLFNLKPAGAIDPIDPALILPDVTDPELIKKTWYDGRLPWVDADHTNMAPTVIAAFALAVNTNLVKDGEIKSYRDLLDPKWQGKLMMDDPTVTGIGNSFTVFAEEAMGWDYLVQLAKAKPIIMRDQRLAIDWLTHGKAALLLGPRVDLLAELMRLGAPVKGIIPAEGTFVFGGSCNIAMFNRPPNPNAAKVFLNWYLSKEGQTIVAREAAYQSVRLDIQPDHLAPEQVMRPGVKYQIQETEKLVAAKSTQIKKSQEIFGPLLK